MKNISNFSVNASKSIFREPFSKTWDFLELDFKPIVTIEPLIYTAVCAKTMEQFHSSVFGFVRQYGAPNEMWVLQIEASYHADARPQHFIHSLVQLGVTL